MQYKQLVKRVQDYSGFSDQEAEGALRLIVEKLATRLTQSERKDFASQLPDELEDLALSGKETQTFSAEDMLDELCEQENINKGRAKKQVFAVWRALKDAISPGEIKDIKAQLPEDLVMMLH
jgi:uncharacterized protein (DUF2267 family)